MTQQNVPLGPIVKAPVLYSKECQCQRVASERFHEQLSENVSFRFEIVLVADNEL